MVAPVDSCQVLACACQFNIHGDRTSANNWQVLLSSLMESQTQTHQDGGSQRLQNLLLLDAAQEAQRGAPQELVGVLQVVAQVLADEDLRWPTHQASAGIMTLVCSIAACRCWVSRRVSRCSVQVETARVTSCRMAALTISGRIFPFASVFSIVSCRCGRCLLEYQITMTPRTACSHA